MQLCKCCQLEPGHKHKPPSYKSKHESRALTHAYMVLFTVHEGKLNLPNGPDDPYMELAPCHSLVHTTARDLRQ